MKISELSEKTGVSIKTIHFYIREGLLRKPHKSTKNSANYTQSHVKTLSLIKDLRENFFLPLPEIKKVLKEIKKQPKSDLLPVQLQSRYMRPLDRLLPQKITGVNNLCEATGIGKKWLKIMEEWEVINPKWVDGKPVYENDNIILCQLIMEFERLGFGPKSGTDPIRLKHIADFIREHLLADQEAFLRKLLQEKSMGAQHWLLFRQYEEVMSHFIYHLFKRLHKEGYERFLESNKEEQSDDSQDSLTMR